LIERERHGAVEVVRMQRPPVNALDVEFLEALEGVLQDLEGSDAGAVVLTGTGRCFSAGVDLRRVVAGGAAYVRELVPRIESGFLRLFAFPRPGVAAINGHAIAGGCVLAFACDHRIMVDGEATIGVPELVVGVPWPVLALEVVRFAVPHFRAQELVYSGRTMGPEEAHRIGIVEETIEPEHLLQAALESAGRLGGMPAEAFRMAKLQLRGPSLDHAARRGAEQDRRVVDGWAAPETLQAIADYLDRTVGKRG
jgi:enoyl-CoA hydratase